MALSHSCDRALNRGCCGRGRGVIAPTQLLELKSQGATSVGMGVSSNFDFLAGQDDRLARLGALAERYFFDDAPSTLIKLRQLGEFLTKEVAARHGLLPSSTATFAARNAL